MHPTFAYNNCIHTEYDDKNDFALFAHTYICKVKVNNNKYKSGAYTERKKMLKMSKKINVR